MEQDRCQKTYSKIRNKQKGLFQVHAVYLGLDILFVACFTTT